MLESVIYTEGIYAVCGSEGAMDIGLCCRCWDGGIRNGKTTQPLKRNRNGAIPDSYQAEYWYSDSVFLFQGQVFKVMPDFKIIRLTNGIHKTK